MTKKKDKALLVLQEIDSTLDRLKQDIESMPEKQELALIESTVKETRDKKAEAEEILAASEHDQKKREDESSRLEEKIKNEEKKLYAGTVNSPKELMSLQQEIKVLSDDKDTVDTEYLIALDELAESQAQETEMNNALREEEARVNELTETIAKKTKELNDSIAAAEEKRQAPLKDLDEMTLKTYEQMRVKGHGTAVATATDGVCGGCHLENSEDSSHGASDGPVRRCEYCHRILITT